LDPVGLYFPRINNDAGQTHFRQVLLLLFVTY